MRSWPAIADGGIGPPETRTRNRFHPPATSNESTLPDFHPMASPPSQGSTRGLPAHSDLPRSRFRVWLSCYRFVECHVALCRPRKPVRFGRQGIADSGTRICHQTWLVRYHPLPRIATPVGGFPDDRTR